MFVNNMRLRSLLSVLLCCTALMRANSLKHPAGYLQFAKRGKREKESVCLCMCVYVHVFVRVVYVRVSAQCMRLVGGRKCGCVECSSIHRCI